jgi:hypothetical protein
MLWEAGWSHSWVSADAADTEEGQTVKATELFMHRMIDKQL